MKVVITKRGKFSWLSGESRALIENRGTVDITVSAIVRDKALLPCNIVVNVIMHGWLIETSQDELYRDTRYWKDTARYQFRKYSLRTFVVLCLITTVLSTKQIVRRSSLRYKLERRKEAFVREFVWFRSETYLRIPRERCIELRNF